MFKKVTMAAVFITAGFVVPSIAAPSDADCKAMWIKADADKSGSVDGAEAVKYLDAIKKSGKVYDTDKDGKLSQAEFTKACKDGVFASIK